MERTTLVNICRYCASNARVSDSLRFSGSVASSSIQALNRFPSYFGSSTCQLAMTKQAAIKAKSAKKYCHKVRGKFFTRAANFLVDASEHWCERTFLRLCVFDNQIRVLVRHLL